MDWDHVGNFQSDRFHRELLGDPVRFLEGRVFGEFPLKTDAVGFKIFYYHAREGTWEAVWPYLIGHPEIRVLHMKRRNILATHLSRKRAEITDSWVNTTGAKEVAPAVVLDYEECLMDFEETRSQEEENDKIFCGHPMLEVVYEDLAGDYDKEMRRIFKFLDLKPEPVRPKIFKQSQRSLSESISNYAELKQKFEGTRWTGFFPG